MCVINPLEFEFEIEIKIDDGFLFVSSLHVYKEDDFLKQKK